MKVKLVANRRMTYGTRHLEAGQPFEAETKFARILIAQKRATEFKGDYPGDTAAAAPAKQGAEDDAQNAIVSARAEYERVTGRKPFNGWDIEVLRQRTAAAQQGQAAAGEAGGTDMSAEGNGD